MQNPNKTPDEITQLNNNNISTDKSTSTFVNGILGLVDFTEVLNFKIKNLDDLIDYNNKVDSIINYVIIGDYNLNSKSEKFIEAFKAGLISKFPEEDPENADRAMIMDLLEKKNGYKQILLIECIKRGNLDLPGENLEDIINLINCGVFDWMNGVYRKMEFAIKEFGKSTDLGKIINYGMPSKEGPIGYQNTLVLENIDENILSQINNPFLREYFYKMLELARNGNYNYDDWVKAEINEVNSWLSTEQLAFIAPMENYKHENFVDPELLVLLREKMEKESSDYAQLSERVFGNGYGMEHVNIYLAEPIINGGEQVYNKFMGKSFPNDMELREKYGNFIIIIKGQIHKAFKEYGPYVTKIFDIELDEYNKNKKMIIDGAIEEVTYHEYGHSIFTTQHHNNLEETKATLFYWAYLYEKYITNNEPLDKNEINRIVQSFTLDFTRYLTRLKKPKYRKYIYTAQVLLKHMLDSNILIYNEETKLLSINNNEDFIENFKAVLIQLKSVTSKVKSIYDNKDKQGEDEMTKYYNYTTLDILNNLFTKF